MPYGTAQPTSMNDRRRAFRTKVCLAAKIRTGGRPPLVFDCVVRDISSLGARVELRDPSKLANIFELTFDSGRTLRACHVVWRGPMHVGVEFSP
jgi:PilZ domain